MGRNSNQHICCLNGLSLMNAQKISKSTFNLYVQYMANPEKKKNLPLQAKIIIIKLAFSGSNEMKVNLI